MSIVTLSFVITGWLGKLRTCSRRSMRAVDPDVIRFVPLGSVSTKRTSIVRGRSIPGMRMLSPERPTRSKRPQRSMTITSAWPITFTHRAISETTKTTTMPVAIRPTIFAPYRDGRIVSAAV